MIVARKILRFSEEKVSTYPGVYCLHLVSDLNIQGDCKTNVTFKCFPFLHADSDSEVSVVITAKPKGRG